MTMIRRPKISRPSFPTMYIEGNSLPWQRSSPERQTHDLGWPTAQRPEGQKRVTLTKTQPDLPLANNAIDEQESDEPEVVEGILRVRELAEDK